MLINSRLVIGARDDESISEWLESARDEEAFWESTPYSWRDEGREDFHGDG